MAVHLVPECLIAFRRLDMDVFRAGFGRDRLAILFHEVPDRIHAAPDPVGALQQQDLQAGLLQVSAAVTPAMPAPRTMQSKAVSDRVLGMSTFPKTARYLRINGI